MIEEPADPGWPGINDILWTMVPVIGPRRIRGRDPMIVMRQVFISFCSAIVLFAFVLSFMDLRPSDASISEAGAVAVVGVVGLVALVGARRFGDRPLDCTTTERLQSSYRTRFFVRLAFGETPALVGFVFVFLSQSLWPYAIGAAFTAVGFAFAAPTKRQIVHDQQRLSRSGCQCSLVAALQAMPSTGTSSG